MFVYFCFVVALEFFMVPGGVMNFRRVPGGVPKSRYGYVPLENYDSNGKISKKNPDHIILLVLVLCSLHIFLLQS